MSTSESQSLAPSPRSPSLPSLLARAPDIPRDAATHKKGDGDGAEGSGTGAGDSDGDGVEFFPDVFPRIRSSRPCPPIRRLPPKIWAKYRGAHITIGFFVDTTGRMDVRTIFATDSPDTALSNEVIRYLRAHTPRFSPGRRHGRKVRSLGGVDCVVSEEPWQP